ncbi:uncharacterized protein LOC126899371 [Daktulosphaira vitifoliae]|uniref:uncharacterized protein LOC126899371 n=1 Tax=Daktulosphaira vitifoliae TaxID=58002 RepID=UPI0021AAF2D1|nr:uncharacterized protein LOC126899371 [Daktulosphaira vitifoliae]
MVGNGCRSNVIALAVCISIVATTITCHSAIVSETSAASSLETVARPTRPKTFGSPGELRTYLDQLGQYLSVVSRPRFGKRKQPITPNKYFTITDQQYGSLDREYNGEQEPSILTSIRNAKDLYQLIFGPKNYAYSYPLRQQLQQYYYGDSQNSPNTIIDPKSVSMVGNGFK